MESPVLTPRQGMLLRLIIQENVRDATPVASRMLVDRYNLDISTATVRNEMAYLEELGYLMQPHTSAGRVPTEKGFRYFVERLMEEQALPPVEQRMIAHQFHQARDRIGQWIPLAASVLARTTRGAAVVTAPRAVHAVYKHLELIVTHGRAVLMILVLQGGTIKQRMLALSTPLNQGELSEIADRLNQLCSGLTAGEVMAHLATLPPLESDIAQLVVTLMGQTAEQPADELYHRGLPELLQEPEFAESEDSSADLVRVLEEQSLLQTVIADVLSPTVGIGGVRVLIGGEGRWEELRACSMILTRYGVANHATGTLGVLGPIRMPYGRAIAVIRFVANVLNEMVYEMYEPFSQELLEDQDDQEAI
ncbi:MAG: heat-inducible transcriptional repressor HrcA [Anaerolineae bacterium]|nr:heat-inducible transcriptional repressor HrcA [Anaerolineae bacterium]